MPLCKGPFCADLWNLLDLHETSVVGVFEVSEFESGVKIEVAQFLVDLGPIFYWALAPFLQEI